MRKLLMFALLGVLAGAIGCGGSSAGTSKPGGNSICTPGSSPNCVAITVDAGPSALAASEPALNSPFVSVTVCVHGSALGSASCKIIDHVLVDTGSIGLRLLSVSGSGELPVNLLPPVTDAIGNPITECGEFVDSVVYGSVRYADIYVGGESTASTSTSGVPIQVIGDRESDAPATNLSCGAPPAIPVTDTLQTLGANGILGTGFFPEDCGNACYTAATSGTVLNYPVLYYSCPASGCVFTTTAAGSNGQQLLNPVVMFPTDNNGTIVELPTISSSGQSNVAGSLVFGIGTQSNNGVGSAAVFPTDPNYGTFYTVFGGSPLMSYIDSGSNALYILTDSTPGLSVCPSPNDVFFCSNVNNVSVQNEGVNGTPIENVGGVDIANADTLFVNNATATAYSNLAGPSCSTTGNPDLPSCSVVGESWDWGLPFFFGRNVYTGIESNVSGPYFAY